ncbi:Utp14-domain-containing protein [Auriscalpium vulgare]|uniref:Utp14-domain-containing protein n=1 Tax=Auriscalpium vulgare TaxID=40419 RepID=A0ACB8S3Y3_9AGAM|nr:Utp14-domain-containing protein [Auriscalpium vulgare]
MAGPARNGRSGGSKSAAFTRKSNATGYAKRQSRKATGSSGFDVYEHQQQKVRRGNVKLTLDKEEAAEFGEESDDEVQRNALRARLIGETVDNEQIDPDDDEELDSDEAFEESDNERFAGFSFASKGNAKGMAKPRGKLARPTRLADVDLNEDEDGEMSEADHSEPDGGEEEEEGEPDEFFDILDVLDGRAEPEHDEGKPEVPAAQEAKVGVVESRGDDGDWGSEDGDENEDEDEEHEGGSYDGEGAAEEDQMLLSADEDDLDPDALEGLGNFVSSLDTAQKRKADDDDQLAGSASRRKRRVLTERTEAGVESEFAAQPSMSGKLKLDDLLAPLASQSTNVLSLKKSAKALTSTRTGGAPLSAPLPQRTQERLDREAAYDQTKEEVDKWKDTMKQIKEAEHLSFPLQTKPIGRTSNLELAAKFKPTTELETSIDRLLKQAKMREEDLAKTEELKMNHLSVEEVAARRAEVAKARDLMFRAEAKAKRVAKIKSKTYRRLKKKERQKLAAKLGEDDDEDEEEVKLRREVERAKERATLRHKNTGKWAKAMKSRGELDTDQRQDILDMLDRGDELRRKIRGEQGSDDSDEDGSDEDGGVEGLKARAFEELAELKDDDQPETVGKSKSVFDMKFMRDAAAREQLEVDRQVDDFVKEMGGVGGVGDDDEDGEASTSQDASGVLIQRVGGRVSFRPGNPLSIPSRQLAPSETSSTTLKSTDLPLHAQPSLSPVESTTFDLPSAGPSRAQEINPWLVPRIDLSKVGPKRNEVSVGKDSTAAVKSKNKLKKRAKEREEEKERAKDDAVLELSADHMLLLPVTASSSSGAGLSKQKRSKKAKSSASGLPDGARDEDDGNSEVEEQEQALSGKGKGKANGTMAFQQRDLVALAFAGDNVVQDFEEAKRREIQEDAPHEVDTTLAGWGSWGGTGTRKAPPKPHLIKKIAGIDPKSRADYGKAHVIISEKRDKKAAKYLVKDLPHPYTSRAQFERSLDTRVGTEWNTRLGFQRATMPKVTKKMGTVINPLEKLF